MDSFDMKVTGITEALKMFHPNIVISAARSTVNRVSSSGKTEAGRLIREQYNINQSRLNDYLKLTSRASGYKIEAVITGRGRGLALAYFDAKQKGKILISTGKGKTRRSHLGSKYGSGYAGNVTVRVKRSSGRKVVGPVDGNRAFMQRMKSGHVGVWVRTSKQRLPVRQLLGPGVGGLFGTKRVMDGTKKKINDQFGPEFNRQMSYYLSRAR
jgi:hypothetical protein